MWVFLLSQVRHRPGRALALFVGVAIAAASFTVLSGSVRSSHAQVIGVVRHNFRSAYDLLVRPAGSKTHLEQARGLVRDNYLSGIFGGITLSQYHRIAAVPGVAVAAPIAMLGYVSQEVDIPIELAPVLTRAPRQIFGFSVARTTDRGLAQFPDDQSGYVYVTKRPLEPIGSISSKQPFYGPTEVLSGGRRVVVCPAHGLLWSGAPSAFDAVDRAINTCWSSANGNPLGWGRYTHHQISVIVDWQFPFLVAAIDPHAEARLAGLRHALVAGRYLRPDEGAGSSKSGHSLQVPVLIASRAFDDDTDKLIVRRLSTSVAQRMVAGLSPDQVGRLIAGARGSVVLHRTVTSQDAYRLLLRQMRQGGSFVDNYWTAGPTNYRRLAATTLTPLPVSTPKKTWASYFTDSGYAAVPIENSAPGFRRLGRHVGSTEGKEMLLPQMRVVGQFDPSRLPGFSRLSAVPMETYNPPLATGANPRTRRLLGGRSLLPNGSINGYLQPPPLMLTTLNAASAFTNPDVFPNTTVDAPISVIRVRVAGVTGPDPTSLARIEQVATLIHQRTGLDVDITAGSSPAPMRIRLPGNRFGRPVLTLSEGWTEKGVALRILSAVDRKSLALFALVFVVCALFVSNAATASVRARRHELGVLACIGWAPRRLFGAVLSEVSAIGLAGGLVGVGAGWAIAATSGLRPSPLLSGLAVPAAFVVAVASGLVPAMTAAAAEPIDAVRPVARHGRRAHLVRGVLTLAAGSVVRAPGRAVVAAAALGVAVAGFTVLLAITRIFRGAVVGSLLGNAVSVQVRGVDYLAVGVIAALGAAAVADVLIINTRERASELATLFATGWREGTLAALVTAEGALIGALGSLLGGILGVAAAVLLGAGIGALVPLAAAGFGAGVVVAALASLVPATLTRRLPTTELLAEEP